MQCDRTPAIQAVLMTAIVITVSATRDTEDKLMADLMANYTSKMLKPNGPNNQVLRVFFDVGMIQLIDVDEKNGIIDGFYWIYQQRTDEKLSWDPTQYRNFSVTLPPEESIWTPNIALNNDADQALSKSSMTTSFLRLFYNGMVTRTRVVKYRSSCTMSLKHFPFDEQNCTLSFTTWHYTATDLNLTSLEGGPEKVLQYENSEFEMLSITSSKEINPLLNLISLNYHFIFRRRPAFYLLSMLLPCTVITLVAMLAFCIPPESGEKIGLGVTVLLSLSVFLLILSDQMPPMTEIPLIGVYYFGITLVVALSTSLSVLTSNLHYNAVYRVNKVPRWAEKVFLHHLANWLCMREFAPEEILPDNLMVDPCRPTKSNGKPVGSKIENLEDYTEHTEGQQQSVVPDTPKDDVTTIAELIKMRENGQKMGEYTTDQWRYLSMVVDRCLFVVFVLLNSIFTMWIILQTAFGRGE